MRIAILTFHRAYNCGAMLQAWALKTVLERMGHSIVFPDCQNVGEVGRFYGLEFPRAKSKPWLYLRWLLRIVLSIGLIDRKRHLFRRFRDRYLSHCKLNMDEFKKQLDLVIVGSDQVWNPSVSGRFWDLFLGVALPVSIPVVGFALSAGDDIKDDWVPNFQKGVERMSAISTREESLEKILQPITPKSISSVLDPTMLLSKSDYDEIQCCPPRKGRYIFVYATPSASLLSIARKIARAKQLELVVGGFYVSTRELNIPEMFYPLSPDALIGAIRNAEYVLTNSFHGTALSIVFRKKFLSCVQSMETRGRIRCLLDRIGLSARIICAQDERGCLIEDLDRPIPSKSYELIDEFRKSSLKFLDDAVRGEE